MPAWSLLPGHYAKPGRQSASARRAFQYDSLSTIEDWQTSKVFCPPVELQAWAFSMLPDGRGAARKNAHGIGAAHALSHSCIEVFIVNEEYTEEKTHV
jgi:hypothetical protein